MPKSKPDAENALHQLGQRLRDGYAKQHQAELQESLDTVKDTVREEWEKEQKAERSPSAEERTPTQDKTKEEPDRDER